MTPQKPRRASKASAHQWIFAEVYELTPAQAAAVQVTLDLRQVPDGDELARAMIAAPGVFCWRCLLPFSPATARRACRGGARYEAEQNLLAAAFTGRSGATRKKS